MRSGIHIFTAVLLLVAIATSFQMSLVDAALNLIVITAFAAAYFLGSISVDTWSETARQGWMVLLTGLWIAEMFVAPVGVYLVFTLYFVYLQLLDDTAGVMSVLFATSVAIIMQIPGGLTFGGLMGPAVSAVVSLAIHFAFRTLSRISSEREVLLRQLMDTREQLARSEHEAGVIAERQRLAHEIHDTVAQGLSSIQLLLHAAERELKTLDQPQVAAAITRIQQARSASSDNLAEARAMIAALQPASLEDGTLTAALHRLAQSLGSAGQLDISVEVDGDPYDLPMGVEAALLRIAQGAVGNVVKHAQASKARITITYGPGEVRLDVVDNGRGFDPSGVDPQFGHVGLDAIRRRAAEQGGRVEIESAPGGPTAVSAALPTA
ncbi:sensor histidine kinase [Corynebacterium tapiri]|uniref:Sensor histidine kinase n=2 Tax=Corynebacterium tapiri TaxID=1448266 RepID=A0A5C4U2E6_9CORY|nr:sensor histidine kinase [Corynebacterium tapiri]